MSWCRTPKAPPVRLRAWLTRCSCCYMAKAGVLPSCMRPAACVVLWCRRYSCCPRQPCSARAASVAERSSLAANLVIIEECDQMAPPTETRAGCNLGVLTRGPLCAQRPGGGAGAGAAVRVLRCGDDHYAQVAARAARGHDLFPCGASLSESVDQDVRFVHKAPCRLRAGMICVHVVRC